MIVINSLSNEKIKRLKALKSRKLREDLNMFIAEGINTVKELPSSSIIELFVSESAFLKNKKSVDDKTVENSKIVLNIVNDNVFNSISDTVNPAGIIAICAINKPNKIGLGDVALLERVRDPGNLGTILRTSQAMGIKDLILVDCADPYSPKVVRASLGAVFQLNLVKVMFLEQAILMLKGIDIYSLSMNGSSLYKYKKTGQIAIAVGNEAEGVSDRLLSVSKCVLKIPMIGKMESLNAAVSFSIAASYIENQISEDFFSLFS